MTGSTRSWEEIWRERQPGSDPDSEGSLLSRLLAADGYDTGFGSMTETAWRQFVRAALDTLGAEDGASLFEVGCGAGAFLLEARECGLQVGGVDLSPALVEMARRTLPQAELSVGEAVDFETGGSWDFAVACGVLLYFPDIEYAAAAIGRMAGVAGKGMGLFDIPDFESREQAEALRRTHFTPHEYAARYAGLDHLYFDRRWIEKTLSDFGFCRVIVEDQAIPGYQNSAFRFNAFAWR